MGYGRKIKNSSSFPTRLSGCALDRLRRPLVFSSPASVSCPTASIRRLGKPSARFWFWQEIVDRLTHTLGRESVFIDVDSIPAGLDFVDVLSERVGQCDALIAIIGRNWLAGAGKTNLRRLDDLTDFVRIEIEAALNRDVPVIPVLVDGAAMPQADDLPDGLKKLARRQGIEISHTRFDADAERLADWARAPHAFPAI